MTDIKNIFITIILFLSGSLIAYSQNINWVKFSKTLDSTSFANLINPQKYNVALNNLTDIEKWNQDTKINGDSLFNLLSNWNNTKMNNIQDQFF